MQSCDTFAMTGTYFENGKNLLAKNSDRPLGECQNLVKIQGKTHALGETVACTHLTIAQAPVTYTVLGSRPYWIWGFEMGVNEFGLVIGNEAQGSRCDGEKEEGLLGMDLLRLGLERAKTAREAITVMTELLGQYGQNANASQLFDRRYENSYLLVDPGEIWLLETAERQWVARMVPDWAAISNCYSIGTAFDLASPDVERYAAERRWLAPGEAFDFAKAYTMPAPRQTASVPRWRRLQKLIAQSGSALSRAEVQKILRDHFEGEIIEPRNGACYGGFVSICMHAMTWDASQTAASWLVYHDPELGPVCAWAPSLPCLSVYLPVYLRGDVPGCMGCGGAKFDPNSLWWVVERLAMAVSVDEGRFAPHVRGKLAELERELAQMPQMDLTVRMEQAANRLMETANELFEEIRNCLCKEGGLYGVRKEFLQDYCGRVGMTLDA